MQYEKPEIVLLPPALNAVRSHCAKGSNASDNCASNNKATPAAYEADE